MKNTTTKALNAIYTNIHIPLSAMPKTQEQIEEIKVFTSAERKTVGMDSMPIELFEAVVATQLEKEKYRDAMLLICQANWGMRYGDLTQVRFQHFINPDGTFKSRFSLHNGEQKTGKVRYYYNNLATISAICLYLEHHPEKSYSDYLFMSESNNKVGKPLSHTAAENIIKQAISDLSTKSYIPSVITETDIGNGITATSYGTAIVSYEGRYNTHSLRKMYAHQFHETGRKLKENNQLTIDYEMLGLLMLDFAHSDIQTTLRYAQFAEEAKKTIVQHMNTGLDVLEKHWGQGTSDSDNRRDGDADAGNNNDHNTFMQMMM